MAENPQDTLRSKILFAFFAFALGMAIATLFAQREKPTEAQIPALFEYKGTAVVLSDLDPAIAIPLYEELSQSHEKQMQLLKSAALQLHIKRVAQAQNKTEQTVSNELLTTTEPTDDEINEFWNINSARIQRPFSDVREDIKAFLFQQKSTQQRDLLLASLEKSGDLVFSPSLPESPVVSIDTDGFPTKGDQQASVQVVEFADYQCPHCQSASNVMKEIYKKWDGQLKFTYMDFPINRSGISRRVAEGAVCAGQQGKFWEYHDTAFEQQASLNMQWPEEAAKTLNLDTEAFKTCISSPTTMNKVKKSENSALAAGVRSTPTFFVNGVKIEGHNLAEALNRAISAAIGK